MFSSWEIAFVRCSFLLFFPQKRGDAVLFFSRKTGLLFWSKEKSLKFVYKIRRGRTLTNGWKWGKIKWKITAVQLLKMFFLQHKKQSLSESKGQKREEKETKKRQNFCFIFFGQSGKGRTPKSMRFSLSSKPAGGSLTCSPESKDGLGTGRRLFLFPLSPETKDSRKKHIAVFAGNKNTWHLPTDGVFRWCMEKCIIQSKAQPVFCCNRQQGETEGRLAKANKSNTTREEQTACNKPEGGQNATRSQKDTARPW